MANCIYCQEYFIVTHYNRYGIQKSCKRIECRKRSVAEAGRRRWERVKSGVDNIIKPVVVVEKKEPPLSRSPWARLLRLTAEEMGYEEHRLKAGFLKQLKKGYKGRKAWERAQAEIKGQDNFIYA